MAKEQLYIFDTTLRDGAQTQGVAFSVEDKHEIAAMLDDLGVDYIEGGWPGANPTDSRFFDAPPKKLRARLTAFGMTARAGRSAENDPGLAAVLNNASDAACLVAKSWDYHVKTALNISLAKNLEQVAVSIRAVRARKKEALLDAEHFFDGYKANPRYALDCLKAALDEGAAWLVLCDTNGGTLPHEIFEIVSAIKAKIPKAALGIHAHNDTGNAVANSLAAIQAGARQVQGTLNGLGERCGNANLITLLPTLLLKPGFADQFTLNVKKAALKKLTKLSHDFDDMLNRRSNRYAPYVGFSAFAHKGGLHVSAVVKAPETYEHIPPASVGNQRQILVSNQAGRANLIARLRGVGLPKKLVPTNQSDPKIAAILRELKQSEDMGYSYENAEASFALLAWRILGDVPEFLLINSFRVIVEKRFNALGEEVLFSEAVVKANVGGKEVVANGEGDGPVHALDQALRSNMGHYARYMKDVNLVDYKVRILNKGAQAITRVVIENENKKGERWRSMGISPNIVDASFKALLDGIVYHLMRAKAPPPKTHPPKTHPPKTYQGAK